MRSWAELRAAAYKTAKFRFGYEIADDIAQDVMVAYLTYFKKHGTSSKQTIDQAVVDCYRKLVGDNRPRGVKKRQYQKPAFLPLGDEDGADYGKNPPSFEELRAIIDPFLSSLKPQELQAVSLILENKTRREIMEVMQVGECRVSMLLRTSIRTIRERLEGWTSCG